MYLQRRTWSLLSNVKPRPKLVSFTNYYSQIPNGQFWMIFSFAGVHINKPYFKPSIKGRLGVKAPAVPRQQFSNSSSGPWYGFMYNIKPFAIFHMNKCSELPLYNCVIRAIGYIDHAIKKLENLNMTKLYKNSCIDIGKMLPSIVSKLSKYRIHKFINRS